MGGRPRPSLLWQLFAASAVVLIAAGLVLLLSPVSISSDPVLAEAAVVAVGLVVVFGVLAAVLRRLLAPLGALTLEVSAIDPQDPGRRLQGEASGAPEVTALRVAFNALLDRVDEERRASARRALAAQEDERARIARELHDEVAQSLTAVTLMAERLADSDGPVDRDALRQLAATALTGLDDVSRVGRELRPEALDDLGLGNALITLCRRMEGGEAARVVARLEPGLPPLRAEVELVIYRVAQEAIANALRHAQPTRVDVTLAADAQGVELHVADNGRGLPDPMPERSTGLTGMRERADLVGGEITLASLPRRGTQVRLRVPRAKALA